MPFRPKRSACSPSMFHGPAAYVCLLALCVVLSTVASSSLVGGFKVPDGGPSPQGSSRAAPSGYSTLDDLVLRYPSHITGANPSYTVLRSLELGPSVLLYVSAGQSILFREGTYLNLSGPPLFDGTMGSPILLRPAPGSATWGGLNLLESDPETPSKLRNVSVERANIGIRSFGSDLHLENARIEDCLRSGLEIGKVTSPKALVTVTDTALSNCSYYGAQLSDVSSATLDRVTTLGCGTGIRFYKTDANAHELFVLNSTAVGLSLVGSRLAASALRATSGTSGGVTTTYQLLLHSSEANVMGGSLGRSKVCALALSGSVMVLKDVSIGPAFTDGVQSNGSEVKISGCKISSCRESAVHSEQGSLIITGSDLEDNGKGSGSYRYSSLFLRSSDVLASKLSVKGSGDAHVECVGTSIRLENSTLGPVAFASLKLDKGSSADAVETTLPGSVVFSDVRSRVRVIELFVVSVKEFLTSKPVGGAIVDVLDHGKGYIGSYTTTLPSGRTDPISVVVSTNMSGGNTTGLPIKLAASKTGFELTTLELWSVPDSVAMELYPPNGPPTLSLLRPTNGTRAGPAVLVEGYIKDDLGVFKVQVRAGMGPWHTYTVSPSGDSGYFVLNATLPNAAPGQQTLSIQAFDGVHTSTTLTRTVTWAGQGNTDSDGDGLLDMEEDRNGNGLVDPGETDPLDPDTDGDGLSDGLELDDSDGNVTDPLNPDTDGDFLLDGIEDANENGRVDPGETDPNEADTDGDGVSDKDDHYPLDPKRSRPDGEDGSGDAMTVLILAIVIVILLGLTVYLVLVKTAGTRVKAAPRTAPRRPGPGVGRDLRKASVGRSDRGERTRLPAEHRPSDRTRGRRGG